MHSIEELQDKIKKIFSKIQFNSYPKELYEPISYTLRLEGKRIRPLLVLMSCDLFNGEIEKAVNPAIGIEIFHNFTLLHDDIMDQSPIRRGKETVYKKWNTNTAILSGDTMFALAYRYITNVDTQVFLAILELFNNTSIKICEGQQYDINYETSQHVSIDDYLKMIHLKTAVLLGTSLKIGALIAHANKEDAENIYRFGENIGIAFQLKDDLLDVYANERVFGKRIGSDIVASKKTFLYLKALELAQEKTKYILKQIFNECTFVDEQKIETVKRIYDDLNVAKYTQDIIEDYYKIAMEKLNRISVNDEQKAQLKFFTEKLMMREK